jgi:hypothetical protein
VSLQNPYEPSVKKTERNCVIGTLGLRTKRGQKIQRTIGSRNSTILRFQVTTVKRSCERDPGPAAKECRRLKKARLAAARRRLRFCDAPLCHSQRVTKNNWNFARAPKNGLNNPLKKNGY